MSNKNAVSLNSNKTKWHNCFRNAGKVGHCASCTTPLVLWYRKLSSVMSLEGRASLLLSVTNIHVFYVHLLSQCLLLFPQIWNIVASSNKAGPLPLRWPFLSNPRFQFKSKAFLSPIVSHHRGNVEKKNEGESEKWKRWPLYLAWGGSSCWIFWTGNSYALRLWKRRCRWTVTPAG